MNRGGINVTEIPRVYVRIIFILLAGWIVGDISKLIVEVFDVPDAMLVIAAMPDCSCGMFAGGKGISAFDELDAFRS